VQNQNSKYGDVFARVVAHPAHDAPRDRSRPSPEALKPTTLLWLIQLPDGLKARELAWLYPRIANKLSGYWINPALRNRYLSSLLMDSRDGAREGFPMAVASELVALLGAERPARENSRSGG
jgi:hypothetical protein